MGPEDADRYIPSFQTKVLCTGFNGVGPEG